MTYLRRTWMRKRLLVILLLAFTLRIWNLGARPLWWDEGLTLTFSRLAPAANVTFAKATEDVNPPLYRWTVGGFTALAGTNVLTTRLVSVYASLITAAAFFTLVRKSLGTTAAGWALFLLALAPMHIYYGQEAKGYSFASASILVAVLLWGRMHAWLLRPHTRGVPTAPWTVWFGFAVVTTLALGANYLTAFGLLVLNIYSLYLTIRLLKTGLQRHLLLRHWTRWLLAQAAAFLPAIPFVFATLDSTAAGLASTSGKQNVLALPTYLWEILTVFSSGEAAAEGAGALFTAVLLFLAAIGLIVASRASGNIWARMWLAWLLVPVLLGYFFQIQFPWFFPRFLLFAQPGLLALAGVGLSKLMSITTDRRNPFLRQAIGLPVLAALAPVIPLIVGHYRAPPRFPEDPIWPKLFEEMGSYVQEGDVVIARLPWMPGYMLAYLPTNQMPDWVLGFFDEPNLDSELGPVLEKYDRIWEIDYGVNPLFTQVDTFRWLQGRAALVLLSEHNPGTLSLFVDKEVLIPHPPGPPEHERYQNGIHVQWHPTEYIVRPGDVVGVDLTWWTTAPLKQTLVRFLHLTAPSGELIGQFDSEPALGYAPTEEWVPGRPVNDPVALIVPLDRSPGEYDLKIGLYDRNTLERVRLSSGEDHFVVGRVTVK